MRADVKAPNLLGVLLGYRMLSADTVSQRDRVRSSQHRCPIDMMIDCVSDGRCAFWHLSRFGAVLVEVGDSWTTRQVQ